MPSSPGDRLGPYSILDQIGRGGMGEVFRAHDTRIGRDVAIKIASEQFSERFDREARAVAALNHPNICTLHDVGPDYLVMELVDGESPAGPLPVDTAIAYARQIADALDAAHQAGIIHRDLKPGNIKIRQDGTVKVLDFGLAKFAGPSGGHYVDGGGHHLEGDRSVRLQPDPSYSPTMSLGATHVGVILGTAAYMAPEQARGKAVDKRADIWAFGVVFYEMLTGRRPFDGEDTSSVLAAVIQSEPSWQGVPAQLRPLLASCLEKDPRKRLRDIGDAWKLLADPAGAAPSRSNRALAGWGAAAAFAVAAAIALWAPWRAPASPADRPVVRLEVDLGSDVSLIPLLIPTMSTVIISPDATRLAYLDDASGSTRLVTRRLDQVKADTLTGTDNAANPFFSNDGKWIGFYDGRRIVKVSVNGGAVVPLLDTALAAGASWSEDGSVLVGAGPGSGVLKVSTSGETSAPFTKMADGELFHAFPQMLPGGAAVLMAVYGTPPNAASAMIETASIADGRRKVLVRGGTSPRYLPSGHLIYTNQATMFAVPFDVSTLELRGTPVPVLDDVAFDAAAGSAQYDVSRTGTLVYRKSVSTEAFSTTLNWIDSTGRRAPLLSKPAGYLGTPRLSPDGQRIVMAIRDGVAQDVWFYDGRRDAMTRLTFGGAAFVNPVWSREGRFVVFGSIGSGMFWTRADGSIQPRPLFGGSGLHFPTGFSADGKRLAFYQVEGTAQLWSVPIEADGDGLKAGKPEKFLASAYNESDGVFSPDGRWMAYGSTESGKSEVYVRAFPAPADGKQGKQQVSNNGGTFPVWSPNGRELLYRAGERVMSVAYDGSGPSFVAEKPRVWADKVAGVGFDITPDGTRLAVSVPVATRQTPREHVVVIVQNFFDELRRRAPIGR